VCRIEDGNSNKFLIEPRLIEEFLRSVEPKYDIALRDLRDKKISTETIYVIAGFAAAVSACAPASMRIGAPSVEKVVEATSRIMDRNGALPVAPDSLGGKTLTELIEEGAVKINIDEKFLQAIGIAGALHRVSGFGNADWAILRNPFDDSPYFTSDFPVAVHEVGGRFGRLLPLAPDLAVAVFADPAYRKKIDLSFSGNRRVFSTVSRDVVRKINQDIVRSAESAVFFRDDFDWIPGFVANNARYRIEFVPEHIEVPRGIVTKATTKIVPWRTNEDDQS